MRLRTFTALTLLAAASICVVAYLGRPEPTFPSAPRTAPATASPDHVFVPDRAPGSRIDCPLALLPDPGSVWARKLPWCALGVGWTPAQSWGRWAVGRLSSLTVRLDTLEPRSLIVEARANPDLPQEPPQMLRLRVNGHDLDRQRVSTRWQQLRFELPAEVLRIGPNEVVLEFEARISPAEAGRGSDERQLAAAVRQIVVPSSGSADQRARATGSRTRVWDASRAVFNIQRSGTLVVPVEVPAGASELRVGFHATRSVDPDQTEVVLRLQDLDGGGERVVDVAPEGPPDPAVVAIDAGHLAGRRAILTVETRIASGQLDVSLPEPVPSTSTDPGPAVEPAPAVAADPPDIVIITLDAARADRFSYAGNTRATTPNIDRLAAESLVFPNAYALAPYTLCSVPTMITGLSFLDHGVVGHEDVLSDDAVTLAEVLKETGYNTACFSATPNNSRAKGFDQGYEVFREMWTEGPRNRTRRAYFIARQVVGWLETVADDPRPLHLQVHMVPPHAPYDPPPQFDLFTDPEYRGPCKGWDKTLSGLDGGALPATRECLDHLLGLYDGNLRTADNATGAILNALRRRPRWRNTVVLITSDHGEAFFEHGRMDHNSTLYTEMMHVPFVLRVPPGIDTGGVETNRLVTLADIMPTLVGAASLPAPPLRDAVDLLRTGGPIGSRFLVARTAELRPTYGLRTLASSLMLDGGGSGELYDLSTDPDERHNLFAAERARFAGLGLVLTRRVEQPPELTAGQATADISDEERALLETLGYVR